ncbi:MAG TPA: LuxR C-terminal-related transcriptional regulator [Gaiellaceae bacterium]|nr:LuxR C-terminal-related transcriptional regulator [Gaiellaceae bacterium]
MSAQIELERGREAYARRAWSAAYGHLAAADEVDRLATDDLELLATTAFMLGRDDEYIRVLERAHHDHLTAGETGRAIRNAVWIGLTLLIRGEVGPGSGWIGRAQRLLEREPNDTVERGYLLMPLVFRHEAAGDFEGGAAIAAEAAAIAERFGDADGFALATHAHGTMLVKAGRVQEGLALLDEAMVSVTAREVSPIATGIVYCGVILACQEVYEVGRAREWTAALTRWCEGQPDVLAFTGRCLVHRAEIMQLNGEWPYALEEAQRARQRFIDTRNERRVGLASYREAELHRLTGDYEGAENAYREANRYGWEPQPGLAQLRLAQGNVRTAVSTIRRALDETGDALTRVRLLPAYVEIMLAAGDFEAASRASLELERLSDRYESAMLIGIVAFARGAVLLAQDDARAALASLRKAADIWQHLEAPYELARTRELVGLACRALGDAETATLELDAARAGFEQLGAQPDVERVLAYVTRADGSSHGLTPRELDVLRLVASGRSNKQIAAELVISEHTVARHVQNIFAKLDVSSRTAAASFAFEHQLV